MDGPQSSLLHSFMQQTLFAWTVNFVNFVDSVNVFLKEQLS